MYLDLNYIYRLTEKSIIFIKIVDLYHGKKQMLKFRLKRGKRFCWYALDADPCNEASSLQSYYIQSMFPVTLDLPPASGPMRPMSNWLLLQVSWKLGWKMGIDEGLPLPLQHRPPLCRTPLPCAEVHIPASPFQYRDSFHKRLMDKNHVNTTVLLWWVYPLFIRCTYIFYKTNVFVNECSVCLFPERNKKCSLGAFLPHVLHS